VILVADDDYDTRFVLKLLLEKAGFDCLTAASGRDALRLAQQQLPQLLIVDVNMPDMSGLQVYESLAQHEQLKTTPVLFLASVSDLQALAASGVESDLCINKPFNKDTLLATVRAALSRNRRPRVQTIEDFRPGAVIADRYEVISEVGRGGMGVVFKVLDRERHEYLALKALNSSMGKQEAVGRFEREVGAMTKLAHPNLIRLYDADFTGSVAFYTMDLLDGASLQDVLDRRGALPPAEALAYTAKVGHALQAAHDMGFLHRDVKPDNVMFADDGEPVLMDFSLILEVGGGAHRHQRMTGVGMVVGTVGYLAPEALVPGADLDNRADIYSLGVTLYQMLVGQIPFEGFNDHDIMVKTFNEEPPLPTTVDPLLPYVAVSVCMRALKRNPAERFASAAEFAEACRIALDRVE